MYEIEKTTSFQVEIEIFLYFLQHWKKLYVCHSYTFQPQMQSQNPRMESISYYTGLPSFNILPSVVIPLLKNYSRGIIIMRLLSDNVFVRL